MAHKKGLGSSKNGRDSNVQAARREGLRRAGRSPPGSIIVRQKGTEFHPGPGAALGRDHTVFALVGGMVGFERRRGKRFVTVAASDADALATAPGLRPVSMFQDRAMV